MRYIKELPACPVLVNFLSYCKTAIYSPCVSAAAIHAIYVHVHTCISVSITIQVESDLTKSALLTSEEIIGESYVFLYLQITLQCTFG